MTLERPMFPPRAAARPDGASKPSGKLPKQVRRETNAPAGFLSRETVLPPAPDHLDEHVQFGRQFYDAAGRAERAGRPALAKLIRIRQSAADQIERLLQFLDDTEGSDDFEQECEDEGAQCDDEGANDVDREPDREDGSAFPEVMNQDDLLSRHPDGEYAGIGGVL